MRDNELEKLTQEQVNELPAQLKMRLAYLKIMKETTEKAKQVEKEVIDLKEAKKDPQSPYEMLNAGYDQQNKEKTEEPKQEKKKQEPKKDELTDIEKEINGRFEDIQKFLKQLEQEQKDALDD